MSSSHYYQPADNNNMHANLAGYAGDTRSNASGSRKNVRSVTGATMNNNNNNNNINNANVPVMSNGMNGAETMLLITLRATE